MAPGSPQIESGGGAYRGAGRAQERARSVLRPISKVLWRFRLEGFENIPDDGPAILCPNHVSFLDSAFTMLHAGRNVSFVGKAEYLDDWKTRKLFPMLGMIPIDRSGGEKSSSALDTAEQVLRRGELFGIFPEGTRSRDGMLYKGHTGAARLALKTGCPILPMGIVGTREIQPPDKVMPKFFREVTMRVGRRLDLSRYADREHDHMVLREITDELMFEIRELTGQEYRNVYATKRSESITTDTGAIGRDDPVSSGK